MVQTDFVDYYEILGVEPDASLEMINQAFRTKAESLQAQAAKGETDQELFQIVAQAYETLSDDQARREFDDSRDGLPGTNSTPRISVGTTDVEQRAAIIKIFADQRRKDMKSPGVSAGRIADLTGIESNDLNFHLWYLFEKKWVDREDNGLLAITASGVDQIN